jgi:acetyl esterase/lipase
MIQITLILLLFCLGAFQTSAQEFIPLWPEKKMPNTKGLAVKDSIANERIYKVGTPGMYAFFPSAQENKGAAVIICPGGGYERLAYIISGWQLAKWFNTMGISAFVLNYRLPNSPDLKERHLGPLQDAQRAMRLIRAHAGKWGIKRDKVGILGTSAGGHLAATLGTHLTDVSAIGDSLNKVTFRPDFMILISPVINLGPYAHAGSRKNLLGPNPAAELLKKYSLEQQVSAATPPAFLVHAANDKSVSPRNSLLFYQALLEKNIPASLHIYPQGGHAIALRNNPGSTETWTELCERWLIETGFLPAEVPK